MQKNKTAGIKTFFLAALAILAKPLTEHVIDDTFAAIQKDTKLLRQYNKLVKEHTLLVVNSFGAKYVAEAAFPQSAKRIQTPSVKNTLSKSYSRLIPVKAKTRTTIRRPAAGARA